MRTIEERVAADGFGSAAPVLFYRPQDANGRGSNFSRHTVVLPNPWTGSLSIYTTGEHRYQALKADTASEHDWVASSPGPGEAKRRGRMVGLRLGWGDRYGDLCWYVMAELVVAKAQQHQDVRGWLRSTGDRPIYEDSETDDIWGVRFHTSYTGKNLLGRVWMGARKLLL